MLASTKGMLRHLAADPVARILAQPGNRCPTGLHLKEGRGGGIPNSLTPLARCSSALTACPAVPAGRSRPPPGHLCLRRACGLPPRGSGARIWHWCCAAPNSGSTPRWRSRLTRSEQIAAFIGEGGLVPGSDLGLDLAHLLGELGLDLGQGVAGRPVEADPGGAALQLQRPGQRGKAERHPVEHPGALTAPLAWRSAALCASQASFWAAAPRPSRHRRRHADGAGSSCRLIARATSSKPKRPASSAIRAWKTTWRRRSPSSSFSARHVAALDRVGDLIGFLDRVGRDRREILLAVPRAAAIGIAQPRHDGEQALQGRPFGGERVRIGRLVVHE